MTYEQIYREAKRNGCTDMLADLLASRHPPGSQTDTDSMRGHGTLAQQFDGDEKALEVRCKIAQKHGYRPSPNDVYMSNVAAFPGDPAAFIKGGRSEVKQKLEKRGWGCHGTVKLGGREPEAELPSKPLGENIIRRKIKERIAQNPDLARRPVAELRAEVIEKHGKQRS